MAAVCSYDVDRLGDNWTRGVMALSKKKQMFINEYLKSFNATKAARVAGYSGGDNALAQRGYELVRNREVAKVISKHLQASAMSADEVVMRLGEQARAEYERYVDEDGGVDLERLKADGKGHLIKGIKKTKFGPQIEFYDSQSALNILAKHHGLLTDRIKQESVNIEVDLNTLNDDQLKRLAAGEDIAAILVDS